MNLQEVYGVSQGERMRKALIRLVATSVCDNDPINPCWANRTTDIAGLHWGVGRACAVCEARAVLHEMDARLGAVPGPSLRARQRSEEWYARTDRGQHEDELDRAARKEFEDELRWLRPEIRYAVGIARGKGV